MEQPVGYYISMNANGAFRALRINDVIVWRSFESYDGSQTLPIDPYLREGDNTIDVTFVSVSGDPYEYNTANPDFYYLAELERLDLTTRERKAVTLLNVALDPATNAVIQPDKTVFDFPRKVRTEPPMLISEGTVDEAPLVSGWGADQKWVGRRVTATFKLDDSFAVQPWADAPVMENTPETRAKLLDAYRKLHAALKSGDRARVRAFYEPAWKHVAATMDYASVDEFIEKAAALESLVGERVGDEVLQPLDLVRGEADFDIEHMAGGRLMRIVPDPIVWVNPKDPDFPTTTNVVFFQDKDGTLKVGMVVMH